MNTLLYQVISDERIQCNLCNHRCILGKNKKGICKVRQNEDNIMRSLVYDHVVTTHIDPIEKKPLNHVLPGSQSFSIATVGCNFKCRFCQNADIAQIPADQNGLILGKRIAPEEIVSLAIKGKCQSISYTYTEPTVYFELAYETAVIAKKNKLKNIFVTNGYMTTETIELIAPYLDAANVDLKAFNQDFYKNYCGAQLEPVKTSIKKMKSLGIFIEITTLIIPGLNDDFDELKALAMFIRNEVGPETPWHISRFHPTYRLLDRPPTPVSTLRKARDIGLECGLYYVYTGNVPDDSGTHTFCHECQEKLIERWGYHILKNTIKNDKCPVCQAKVYGIGIEGKFK